MARLQVVRDGRKQTADRAAGGAAEPADAGGSSDEQTRSRPSSQRRHAARAERARHRQRDLARRLRLPNGVSGVVVARVDPLSAAWDAGIQRDYVVMEINRRPVTSADAYNRLARAAASGDVLAVYVYMPGTRTARDSRGPRRRAVAISDEIPHPRHRRRSRHPRLDAADARVSGATSSSAPPPDRRGSR